MACQELFEKSVGNNILLRIALNLKDYTLKLTLANTFYNDINQLKKL